MTQDEALQLIMAGNNVFLTGEGGTGKTYLINKATEKLRDKGKVVAVTASTGIASTHISGITIHSWSGIKVYGKKELKTEILENIAQNFFTKKNVCGADVLIIDEISMLHAYQFDAIDYICKSARGNEDPFGGLQVIISGDFFQLPPVSSDKSDGEANFVFDSEIWNNMNLIVAYLTESHRQTDQNFLTLLREIRKNNVSSVAHNMLMNRMGKDPEGEFIPLELYSINKDVDRINNRNLNDIQERAREYKMQSWGIKDFLIDSLKKSCISPELLRLKKGAFVMFTKNEYDKDSGDPIYVNGTLGKVIGFNDLQNPIVHTYDDKIINVERASWDRTEYNFKLYKHEVVASVTQIPLRLAWAITIHKSQGMSLDCAIMNLEKTFEHGMGYVALSRVRSLNGIKLLGINEMALQVNEKIVEKDAEFRALSDNIKISA